MQKTISAKKQESSYDAEMLIKRELLPIRADRAYPRNIRSHSAISFIYKIY